jgi:hypothetical protein
MSRIVIVPSKPRNLVAKDLRTPKYRMKVEKSKKSYDRKKLKRIPLDYRFGDC